MAAISRACAGMMHRGWPAAGQVAVRKLQPTSVWRRPTLPFPMLNNRVQIRFSSDSSKKTDKNAKVGAILFPNKDDFARVAREVKVYKDPSLKSLNVIDEVIERVGQACDNTEVTFEDVAFEVDTALYLAVEQFKYEMNSDSAAALNHHLTHLIFEAAKRTPR